jgi:hypothetical protein
MKAYITKYQEVFGLYWKHGFACEFVIKYTDAAAWSDSHTFNNCKKSAQCGQFSILQITDTAAVHFVVRDNSFNTECG